MKKTTLLIVLIISIILSCKSLQNDTKLIINFESKSNSKVTGTATITEKNGVVKLIAKLSGLTPGVHAIHIHEKADCTAADGASAGGHWNPTFKKHGKWADAEHHKGDIGNFTANENGEGSIEFSTNEWCIGCADETKNIIGKGIIIHQGTDDFVSQPSGNAGARVACGALIK